MISVNDFNNFFLFLNPSFKKTFLDYLILKLFDIKFKEGNIIFCNGTVLNKENLSYFLFLKNVYIKLFEIDSLFKNEVFDKDKLYLDSFFVSKKVFQIKQEFSQVLKYNNLEDSPTFVLFFYFSCINNVSKIPEIKNVSHFSLLYFVEKEEFIFFDTIFTSFQKLKKKEIIYQKKNTIYFLILFSLIYLENFVKEIGFSSSKDPFGMNSLVKGVLKNSDFHDVPIFTFLNNLSSDFFYKKINLLFEKKINIEYYLNNFSIKTISELKNIYYFYNVFLSYGNEIKRLKNFCKKNPFLEIKLNEEFKNDSFIFIKNYIENFSLSLKNDNEKNLFRHVNFIFNNIFIKNSFYKNDMIYILHMLNSFLNKFNV